MNEKITFINKPKLSEHEVQSNFNERRLSLLPLVRDFISNHEMFKNKEVNITFAHKGVSSLVSIIETGSEKIILKIPLSIGYTNGEAQFLKVWEQAGVKVPHVIEEGILGEHSYTLMEYINALILREAYSDEECVEKGIYFEMGSTLRLMHEPQGEGYGRIVDGKGEYTEYKDLLESKDIQKRIQYVIDNKLLSDEHGSLSIAYEILIQHTNNEKKSSYCHNDFGASNIFATNPITVFDPSPRFDNHYLDLGRTLVLYIANGSNFPEQLIKGYFKDESYDKKVLYSAILLNSYLKLYYWNQVKKFEQIERVQKYLIQNKHLLIEK